MIICLQRFLFFCMINSASLKKRKMKSARILVALFFFMLPYFSFSQDKEYIPDGTEGEMLEVVANDTLPKKWKDKRWRLFRGKYSTFKFGGGFLYEFAGYSQNANAKKQMD